MSRARILAYVAVAAWLFSGCKQSSTGLHVHVHLGSLSYDELRFAVLEISPGDASGETLTPTVLVDPEGAGRKANLSGGAEQDVVILLPDDVDKRQIVCDVAVLKAGAPVGGGDGTVEALAHEIRDVDVFITAAPNVDAGAPGDAAGAGGTSGEGGASGTGGSVGTGGATGTGGRDGAGGSDAGVDARAEGGASGSGGAGGVKGTGGSGAGGTGIGGANGAGGASSVGGASGTGGKPGTGALGSRCTDAGQCASPSFCVDGVCCESACNTACTTCNFNNGQAGKCRQVMNRAVDPHHVCVDTGAGNCGTDGTCDNTGACATKFNMVCTSAGCASPTSRSATGLCGQGTTCLPVGAIPCLGGTSCVAPNMCQ